MIVISYIIRAIISAVFAAAFIMEFYELKTENGNKKLIAFSLIIAIINSISFMLQVFGGFGTAFGVIQ